MTPEDRDRLQDIASDRDLAPLPTPEDIRLLLAEVRKLEFLNDVLVHMSADIASDRLLEREG